MSYSQSVSCIIFLLLGLQCSTYFSIIKIPKWTLWLTLKKTLTDSLFSSDIFSSWWLRSKTARPIWMWKKENHSSSCNGAWERLSKLKLSVVQTHGLECHLTFLWIFPKCYQTLAFVHYHRLREYNLYNRYWYKRSWRYMYRCVSIYIYNRLGCQKRSIIKPAISGLYVQIKWHKRKFKHECMWKCSKSACTNKTANSKCAVLSLLYKITPS